MGKRQRDCTGCGAPVGLIGRELCCRCTARRNDAAARSACPGCGSQRIVQPDTGRCITCSRTCIDCGHPVRGKTTERCRDCRRKAEQQAAQRPCPRCRRPGYLREDTGWCGHCSRPRQAKQPPRPCGECGQVRRHAGLGLCSACWQRHPDRPFVHVDNLIARLGEHPDWLRDFAAHAAARHCPSRACTILSSLGRLLIDGGPTHPQALLERARRPGRSMGTLARTLEDFFTARRLALPTDQRERLADGRRRRRTDAVPEPLRPTAEAFAAFILNARERSRRAGTRPRADSTVETALAVVRDLARFLVEQCGKRYWAVADVHDLEAFLATLPKSRARRLIVLRQFFRFARSRKVVLVDPTRGLALPSNCGFRGRTLALDEQRALFRRWTLGPDVHPHEAVFGLLALLHGASSKEVRTLTVEDIDRQARTIRLGDRPHPVPLDPASWAAVQRCLVHRDGQRTENPHVMVTKGTKAGRGSASTAYVSHVLDPGGVPPRMIRSTRLVDLVNTMDPKLVAAAFGMDPEATMIYLADRVDAGRLPEQLR